MKEINNVRENEQRVYFLDNVLLMDKRISINNNNINV